MWYYNTFSGIRSLGLDPLQERRMAELNRQGNNARAFIAVQRANRLFKGIKQGFSGFEDNRNLLPGLHLPLPPIDRLMRRQDIGAGRQALLNHSGRYLRSLFGGGTGDIDK